MTGQPDITGSRDPGRYLDGTTRISNFKVILDHTKKITVEIFVFFILGAFEVRGGVGEN